MEFTLSQQIICFLCSILCGVFIGLVYDVFYLLRTLILKGRVWLFVCDFLFMIIAAFASVIYSIGFSSGNTRYFIVLGELIGFSVYRFTVGRWIVRFFVLLLSKISLFLRKSSDKLIKLIKKLLQVATGVLYNIIRRIMSFISKPLTGRGKRHNEISGQKSRKQKE